MKEIAEELGIDVGLIERDLAFHRGVGGGYLAQIEHEERPEKIETVVFAATTFRRAGSHALLLDQTELAKELFADSAKCYDRLHLPYAAMMWSLAQHLGLASTSADRSLLDFDRSEGRYPFERTGQLTYSLLVEGCTRPLEPQVNTNKGYEDRFRRVATEISALSTTPLGIMGIPITSHLHLAMSMKEQAEPRDVQYFLTHF